MKVLLDEMGINRALTRVAHEIIEKNKGVDDIILVGLKTRGVFLAERIRQKIAEIEGVDLPCFTLDTRPFRDDNKQELKKEKSFDSEIGGKTIIIVDDVMYTGRTLRAAIDAVFYHGRPGKIQVAALIDRGHRELPFKPDYIGKNIPTASDEKVAVRVTEVDGEDIVIIN